jgi:hypothetical protein
MVYIPLPALLPTFSSSPGAVAVPAWKDQEVITPALGTV